MAQIWFGDLELEITKDLNCNDISESLENLYNNWNNKHPEIFKDFRPIIISNNELVLNNNLIGWEDDDYLLPFVVQGGEFPSYGQPGKHISWGWNREDKFKNDIISEFTNDLLKILGNDVELNLYWQVTTDGGYESYVTNISANNDSKFPKIDGCATWYEDYDEDYDEEW